MGMNVDFVVAKMSIDELRSLLFNCKEGEQAELCDEIEEFVERMKEKYSESK